MKKEINDLIKLNENECTALPNLRNTINYAKRNVHSTKSLQLKNKGEISYSNIITHLKALEWKRVSTIREVNDKKQ